MEKFTNRVKKPIFLNKKYSEVTFESILSDIITESLDVIVKDDNTYEISGVGNLVDKFTLIFKKAKMLVWTLMLMKQSEYKKQQTKS